jgi:hypothetical protein
MPTVTRTQRVAARPPSRDRQPEDDEARAASRIYAGRAHRLRINAVAWALGTIAITTLWATSEWQANGTLDRFGHEGEPGQWNPTLWAVVVGIWTIVVGIMALRVWFERPPADERIDALAERLHRTEQQPHQSAALRHAARERLARIDRLKFHVAAWVFGTLMLAPIWALIEWQDNGGFERWSNDSQPGNWDPWIVAISGTWGLVVALGALRTYLERPRSGGRP